MNVKLKRIAPLHAGKMLAAFYGLLSLLFVPFMLLFMTLGSFAAKVQSGGGASVPGLGAILGMGVGFMLFIPVIYAVMGFIFGVIAAAIYNLLAGWIGGFEFEFESTTPPTVAPPVAPAAPVIQ